MKTQNIILRIFIMLFPAFSLTAVKGQTITDTIGNTVVEISVALDTSNFVGGYMSGPWDLYWGPDQKLWYTNRTALCRYDPATQTADTLLELPSGFMMGVTTHYSFQTDPYVYLIVDTAVYYGGGQIMNLYRYEYSFSGDSLFNPQFILQWHHPGEHCGGRCVFGADDKLYVSTAEYYMGYDTLFNNSGKVLRINPDGTVPVDNPRADYTYSYGHRNPQGICTVPNGNIFVSEYGQSQDELNLIEENRFYGWIVYDGFICINNPDTCAYYDTTAAFPLNAAQNPPSGIDYYNHAAIPEFNGLVQAVTGASQGLIVYKMNAAWDSVILKSFYLTYEYGRVRDVCAAPDGSLYFIARDRTTPDIRVIRNPLFSSIAETQHKNYFTFFPNPALGEIFYRVSGEMPALLSVSDLTGKNIFSQQLIKKTGTIDISTVKTGCYFVTVKSADGGVVTKKLIKTN